VAYRRRRAPGRPLLIALGLSQLPLIVYGEQGLAVNLVLATLLRAIIGAVFGCRRWTGAARGRQAGGASSS
jgi:hypothetical protein